MIQKHMIKLKKQKLSIMVEVSHMTVYYQIGCSCVPLIIWSKAYAHVYL
jgi:hypothetical protein